MEMTIPDIYEQDEGLKMSQDSSEHSLVGVEGRLYGKHAGQPGLGENATAGKSVYST